MSPRDNIRTSPHSNVTMQKRNRPRGRFVEWPLFRDSLGRRPVFDIACHKVALSAEAAANLTLPFRKIRQSTEQATVTSLLTNVAVLLTGEDAGRSRNSGGQAINGREEPANTPGSLATGALNDRQGQRVTFSKAWDKLPRCSERESVSWIKPPQNKNGSQ